MFFFYPDWRGLELWSNCLLSFFNSLFFRLNSPFFVTLSCRTSVCPEFNFIKLSSASFKHYAALWLTCVLTDFNSPYYHHQLVLLLCHLWYILWMNSIQNFNTHSHSGVETGDAVLKPVNCIVKWGNRVVNIAVLFSFVKSVLHELFRRSSPQHRTNQRPLSHETFA